MGIMAFAWARSLRKVKAEATENTAKAVAEAVAEATINVSKSEKETLVNHRAIEAAVIMTDAELRTKIEESFEIMDIIARKAIHGKLTSLVISGPPGLGKSFAVEKALEEWDAAEEKHSVVKGYVRATGLYKKLYERRHAGNVLIFDDADSVFGDVTCLNLLKAVLDSSGSRRRVSYLSERKLRDADGEVIPTSFDFEGTVIFISNLDFDFMIEREHSLHEHFKAILSRSHYIDMDIKTRREYIVRIKQVIDCGMLKAEGLNEAEETAVVEFIEKNANRMRELSLRSAIKIGVFAKGLEKGWDKLAKASVCKKG
jgi:hypothetical protein